MAQLDLRQLISAAYVLFGGVSLVSGIRAIRKGMVRVSWRSLASTSLQKSHAPIRFWLVVSLDIGVGIAFLWLGWHAA